jgi:hypothetical protein
MHALISFTYFVSNIFRYVVLPITSAWQSDGLLSSVDILPASYTSTPAIGLIPSGARNLYNLRNVQTSSGVDPASYSIVLRAVCLREEEDDI